MRHRLVLALVVLALGCTSAAASRPDDSGGRRDAYVARDARAQDANRSDAPREVDAPAAHFVLRGATVVGLGRADVEIEGGRIVAVGDVPAAGHGTSVDVAGQYLAPAVIDSHVHLTYWPVASELVAHGVVGAVDLAAPIGALADPPDDIHLVSSGPMITAVGGYPTRSWGAGGYGLEVSGAAEARAAVDRVHAAGARIIKVPLEGSPELTDAELDAVVARAHELGLLVAAHALGDVDARRAALAGCDLLAHAPVENLSEATVTAWRGRAVVSTLEAFGASATTISNLRRMRAASVTVLYGTDLGNSRTAGVDARELRSLSSAGLPPAAVLAAATSAPAHLFGLEADLGAIAVGREASLLVLPSDPLLDPAVLADPTEVYVRGIRR